MMVSLSALSTARRSQCFLRKAARAPGARARRRRRLGLPCSKVIWTITVCRTILKQNSHYTEKYDRFIKTF